MAAPTSTYVNYASGTGHGNDYKGATFTDGAYTSATKTLVKNAAFAATKVGHRIYLESNDGGSIVAGFYNVATWTDANTIILATDAGAGVDDDAAKCTQHDGTTALPWCTVQGAFDLITRDATNGDQVNIKDGTAVVNYASLNLTTYGTPTEGAPLVMRGYTSAAGDGGIGEIDCGGSSLFAANDQIIYLADLEIHNFGNNLGIDTSAPIYHCEIHKGASTPSGKNLINGAGAVVGCYIHDAGATGTGIAAAMSVYNYIYNCPTGINIGFDAFKNILVDCTTPILFSSDNSHAFENTIYSSTANTGSGISTSGADRTRNVAMNNIIEGYSGTGAEGIYAAGDFGILGFNAFYNNTANNNVSEKIIDLTASDQALSSSPFTNAGSGDFSLNAAVTGAIETAFPGTWYGPAGTTNKADMGAVQKGAGTGGNINLLRGKL